MCLQTTQDHSGKTYIDNPSADCYVSYNDLPAVLRPSEAAMFLRIGMNTMYELLKSRTITSVKVGREYRIAKSELLRYMGGK